MNRFFRIFSPLFKARRHPMYANRAAGDVMVPCKNAKAAVELAREKEAKNHLSATPVATMRADGSVYFAVVTSAAPAKGLIRF